MTQIVYLKVKIKSLAAEARIIRHEENKRCNEQNDQVRNQLTLHRVGSLRSEQRSAFLAYGYLRKRYYRQIEANTDLATNPPYYARIAQLITKFGGGKMTPEHVQSWAEFDHTQQKLAAE